MGSLDNSGSRMERRKEETRKKIIEAARVLFEKQGFDDTTMEQIAAKADVAKKTLYNHFPVKEAIIAELLHGLTKGLGPAFMQELIQLPDTRARLIYMATKFLGLSAGQEDIFKAYFAYRMYNRFHLRENQSVKGGGHKFVEELVKLGQQSGELRTDLPVEAYLNHLEIVFAIIVTDMVRRKDDLPLKKSIEENIDIFLDGFRNRGEDIGK